ncbi:MAG: AAA family ATPase [Minisyncoccales bacterium]
MTKIIKLSMKGFKSFADRTDIVLGDNFNCILGPNGSGKSNVLDALVFVLGKGSAKGLRAEKSANLIYNGGKTKNPAKEGEVSIYFDNSEKLFPVSKRFGMKGVDEIEPKDDKDYSEEIKITRIIKNTGQSKYMINDKTVTRQQILDLLSVAKINPDGYNIVLQGDIVRLVEMSPNERRGIIEEISGISIYEEKKQKAINSLTKVEERLNEAELVLGERENYLKELRQDRDVALKYKKLKDKIDSNNATYLNLKIKKANNQLEAFSKHTIQNQEAMKVLNEKLDKYKKQLDENQNQVKEITQEVENRGEKDQIAIHKEVENLKVSINTNNERINSCKTEIERIQTRKDQLENNLDDIKIKLTNLDSQKDDFNNKLKKNKEEIQVLNKKIEEFRKRNKIEDTENIEKEIIELDHKAEEKQKIVLEQRERQQDLLREKDRIEYKIENLDVQIDKVLEIEKESKAELEKLKQKRSEFKKATLELNTLLNEDSALLAQLSKSRSKLTTVNEELSKLNAKNMTLQEAMGANNAVKYILDQKNKMQGIYGLVSEIGEVSGKYSLALEIAAGAKIKSIVVQDDQTASRCIKFLKEKRLGTATFLPLNKIKSVKPKPELDKILKSRGVHGYAVDLVSYDPKFKKVFSYVFGNTNETVNQENNFICKLAKSELKCKHDIHDRIYVKMNFLLRAKV